MKKVYVQLDKKRRLEIDFNAMAAFEDETGDSLFTLGENLSAKQLRALLWAACLHEDPELKIETVGKHVTMKNLNEINEKLGEAMQASNGNSEQQSEEQSEKN